MLEVNFMSKAIFREIDKKEMGRFEQLYKAAEKEEKIAPEEIFGSEVIPDILKEKPLSFVPYFRENDPSIPLNCLLFSRILVDICPSCSCNQKPELIKPYLERGMILPLLAGPLGAYNPKFAEIVIQYPYVNALAYDYLKVEQTYALDKHNIGTCPHCFELTCKRILKKLSKSNLSKSRLDNLRETLLQTTFPTLDPTLGQESQMIKEIEAVIDKGRIELLAPILDKIEIYDELKVSRTFSAIPRVNENDLLNISKISRSMGLADVTSIAAQVEEKIHVAKALGIEYNPNTPIEDYLDTIQPRRKKVNSLINGFISTNKENRGKRLLELNDALWTINKEISTSKAIESLTFFTDFVSNNAQIVLGVLIGGLIGYSSASFAGCGLGTVGGLSSGFLGKLVSKHAGLRVPKLPKTTIEWLKEKIESPEERLLSMLLSKDVRTIQVWSLRKKLKRT